MTSNAIQMFEQSLRLEHVLVVVPHRLGHGFRYDNARREVYDRRYFGVVEKDPIQQRPVGDIALIKSSIAGEFCPTGAEVVKNNWCDPAIYTRRCGGRADISGPSG